MKRTKTFIIHDETSHNDICKIAAQNGKSALKQFMLHRAMYSGMYEIIIENGEYVLCSSYGSYFRAIETEEIGE